MGALLVLIITHPAGFAADSIAGGSVLNNTLSLESGKGINGGSSGSFSTSGGSFNVG
jgi:hypothetical protein